MQQLTNFDVFFMSDDFEQTIFYLSSNLSQMFVKLSSLMALNQPPFRTSRDTIRTGKIAAAKRQLQPTFYFLI